MCVKEAYRTITLPSRRHNIFLIKSRRPKYFFRKFAFYTFFAFEYVLACFRPVWASFGVKYFFNRSAFWTKIMVSRSAVAQNN
jgi:hypothetical protein